MDRLDKPLLSVILQFLLDCINVLDREDSAVPWELTRNSEDWCKNIKPLKDGHTAFRCHPANKEDNLLN